MVPLTAITMAPLDTEALVGALDTTGIGAVTTFIGLVRGQCRLLTLHVGSRRR